jgi:hypothetical protein
MPPSDATNQYTFPSWVVAIPTMGLFSAIPPVEP